MLHHWVLAEDERHDNWPQDLAMVCAFKLQLNGEASYAAHNLTAW